MGSKTNLKDLTEPILSYLFPDSFSNAQEHEYETLDTLYRSIVVYGGIGNGKTEMARSLVERAVQKYGPENVNAITTDSTQTMELLYFLMHMDQKPVQILFLDDQTLVQAKKEDLRTFFSLRHVWKGFTGRRDGLIVTIFATHRFHGLIPEFRSSVDVLFWKSLPFSPYDRNVCKAYVGEQGLETLQEFEIGKLVDPTLKSYSVASTKFGVGLFYLPMATKDYFHVVKKPSPAETFAMAILSGQVPSFKGKIPNIGRRDPWSMSRV